LTSGNRSVDGAVAVAMMKNSPQKKVGCKRERGIVPRGRPAVQVWRATAALRGFPARDDRNRAEQDATAFG
jgi:hypothetical protein